jgi:multiple sugar transport system ATP-binding protein
MAGVVLEGVHKSFGSVKAVQGVSLNIVDKEFAVLVGPSGCGKSTILRMIAGLEEVTRGKVYIGGRLVNNLLPKDRNIAMVFQDYGLYPHMSVYKNMAFGLKLKKMPKPEIDRRVTEAAEILGIQEFLNRRPLQLSGGQRQRVALGRAIVRKPDLFLFDEPLSNLDAKLRVQMRAELTMLHERLQTTVIYVTHDQVEAMTMGTKIVIMRDGCVQQVGGPLEVYRFPKNRFVAGFIGNPPTNFFPCSVVARDSRLFVEIETLQIPIPDSKKNRYAHLVGQEVTFGIRPEHVCEKTPDMDCPSEMVIRAHLRVVEPLGSETLLNLTIGNNRLVGKAGPITKLKPHQEIEVFINMNEMYLFENDAMQSRVQAEDENVSEFRILGRIVEFEQA